MFFTAVLLIPLQKARSSWFKCLALEQNFSMPRSVKLTHSDRDTYLRILLSPSEEIPVSVMLQPERFIPDSLGREESNSTPASVKNSQ